MEIPELVVPAIVYEPTPSSDEFKEALWLPFEIYFTELKK